MTEGFSVKKSMDFMNAYKLEPYKGPETRHVCPGCGRPKSFARYVDETGNYLDEKVGRCNREVKCGYHYTPSEYFRDHDIEPKARKTEPFVPRKREKPKFIPLEILEGSLSSYDKNNLVTYLLNVFGQEVTEDLVGRYYIGTSKHWTGATVFFNIDTKRRVRSGKIMLFDLNGHRVKEPFPHVTSVHKVCGISGERPGPCFFGEHLLDEGPVAVVESEKTALVAAGFLPKFTWIATGSLSNLTRSRCEVLRGRKVILFPDLGATQKWTERAEELSDIASLRVSRILERYATPQEREKGLDLADYLVKQPQGGPQWNDSWEKTVADMPEDYMARAYTAKEAFCEPSRVEVDESLVEMQKAWEREVFRLEKSLVDLPEEPVRLSPGETITNVPLFVQSHLEMCRANRGRTFRPYMERLKKLETVMN